MKGFIERGGPWVISQTLLTLASLVLGPTQGSQSWPWPCSVAAVILIATGAYFGIAGVIALGNSRTVYPRPLQDGRLIRTGIYAWVRHPLYTSLMFVTVGWASWWGSWWALASATSLSLMLVAKAGVEERWLRQKYPDYAHYATKVPRFVPFLH